MIILDLKYFTLVVTFSIILLIPISDASASDNPNLFVSAENPHFDNHFSGAMVVEVVIRDNDIRDTDEGKGRLTFPSTTNLNINHFSNASHH